MRVKAIDVGFTFDTLVLYARRRLDGAVAQLCEFDIVYYNGMDEDNEWCTEFTLAVNFLQDMSYLRPPQHTMFAEMLVDPSALDDDENVGAKPIPELHILNLAWEVWMEF